MYYGPKWYLEHHKIPMKLLTISGPSSSQMGIWCPPLVWIGLKKPYCQKRRYFCTVIPLHKSLYITAIKKWTVLSKKRLNKKLPHVLKIITCILFVPWTQICNNWSIIKYQWNLDLPFSCAIQTPQKSAPNWFFIQFTQGIKRLNTNPIWIII